MSFEFKWGVDRYEGVSIDSAKLAIKSTEPNLPQGQMINAMFGDGFNYRWAVADGLWVCTIAKDPNSAIRQLIDEVKAGGPKQIADEMKAALELLPQASKADCVGTFNFLRYFGIITAFMPIPMPKMDIPTKSNIAFAGRASDGKMTVDIAFPKEHLMEISSFIQKMQQQQMGTMTSATNLKQIGLACAMYANDHNDIFPPNLQVLVEKGYLKPDILESPRKPKDFDGPSYIYISGQTMKMDPSNILVYENPQFCSDKVNILFLDSHVEMMKPDEFLSKLEATYKRLGREMPVIKFKDTEKPAN
jgi:prepilin-type processing-associated H-X9-DG protein